MPSILSYLRSLHVQAELSEHDGSLLRRFRTEHDELAFAAIVSRHGPLVLGIARRLLGDSDGAQDVFQASFLVLARFASRFEDSPCVAGWLVQVARRTALQAQARAARRLRHESTATILSHETDKTVAPDESVQRQELCSLLDAEIAKLPNKYRNPLVLCHLEGYTQDEAARRLGWPIGTLSGRLSRAKKYLQSRLLQKGYVPAIAASAFAIHAADANVSALLAQSTVLLAALTVRAPRSVPTSAATALAQGAISSMVAAKYLRHAVAIVMMSFVFGGSIYALNFVSTQPSLNSQDKKNGKSENEEEGSSVSGQVLDDQGKPVVGAKLCWWEYANSGASPKPRIFTVEGVSGSKGHFHLNAPRHAIKSDINWRTDELWALAPGKSLAAVRAVLDQEGEKQEGTNTIRLEPSTNLAFVVKDPDGKLVQGAVVEPWYFTTPHAIQIVPEPFRQLLRVVSDESGHVRMPAMPADRFHAVRVTTRQYGTQQLRLDGPGIPKGEREILLRPAGRIEGQIVWHDLSVMRGVKLHFSTQVLRPKLEPSGNASENRHRIIWETEGIAEIATDSAGKFIIPAIAEGRVLIDVASSPNASALPRLPDMFQLEASETLSIEIPMERPVVVKGVVRTEDTKQPVACVEVHVGYGVNRQGASVVTDMDGKYLARVLAGRVYTQVIIIPKEINNDYTQPGVPWNENQEVISGAGEQELRPIELTPTKTITGKLIDKEGRPVANGQVMGTKDSRRYGFSRTDANGKFSLQVPKNIDITFEAWTEQFSGPVENKIVSKDPLVIQLVVRPVLPP